MADHALRRSWLCVARRTSHAHGPDPWGDDAAEDRADGLPQGVPELIPVPPDEHAEDRRLITEALRRDDSTAAVEAYRKAPGTIRLADGDQAEIGNRAMAIGDADTAVRAYTALLERRGERTNGPGGSSDDLRLLLSSMLIRRLGRPAEARPHLDALKDRTLTPDAATLRDALLAELGR